MGTQDAKRQDRFRRFTATDLAIATGNVRFVLDTFEKYYRHTNLPCLIFQVFGHARVFPRQHGNPETNFLVQDATGELQCTYRAIDIEMPEDVVTGKVIRVMGRMDKSTEGKPIMQVIKARLALPGEIEKHKACIISKPPATGTQLPPVAGTISNPISLDVISQDFEDW